MCMETGLSRHKNSINVALKNAADFGVAVVVFWLFGFGLMFGTSYNGFFGTDLFLFKTEKAEYMTYFVFQAMFVATAATIISGAVAERMKFVGYLIITVLATGLIYPLVGHWAWSSSYLNNLDQSSSGMWDVLKDMGVSGDQIENIDTAVDMARSGVNKGWLSELGFIDFAGSTIVHSVGGWMAPPSQHCWSHPCNTAVPACRVSRGRSATVRSRPLHPSWRGKLATQMRGCRTS